MAKRRRERSKQCARCAQQDTVMYRVQTDSSSRWEIVCRDCQKEAASEPGYQYGGTWKAIKRT